MKLIFASLIIATAIWFKPSPAVPPELQHYLGERSQADRTIQIDVNDRENGICADMYKQGFKWGYGQYAVQAATMRITHQSEEEIKDELLKMTQNKLENL